MAVKRKTAKRKAPARKTTKRKAPARKKAARKTATRRPAAKKKAAKKALPDTLTLKHLAAELSESHEMPKKQTEEFLSDFIDRMGGYLKKGKRLRIPGLGIMQVRRRAARWGRNPATGEKITDVPGFENAAPLNEIQIYQRFQDALCGERL